jgi:creatinine amidohydrolase
MERKPYLYQHYTWPEMRELVKSQPVVILPIGSVEDHGPHLPIDTDNFLIWSICEAAAQSAPGRDPADAANPVRI